jgi:L-ascorbate metabolism protein UlaG (beta-lactamase superfamily)
VTDIRFLGQSCFELSAGDTRVVVDPFLAPNNPVATVSADDLDATHVLVTHGHADHLADAVAVAGKNDAPTVAIVELAGWLGAQGVANTVDPNLGGTVEFDWGWISLVPAWHTNTIPGSDDAPFSAEHGISIGVPAGLLINVDGKTVYHAGDTCLFSDMKLIAQRSPVDVALLPIGGHYTMDRRDAVYAAEFVGADTVIPMHYNTFPPIETDAEAFKSDVESKTSSKVVILEPGESHSA